MEISKIDTEEAVGASQETRIRPDFTSSQVRFGKKITHLIRVGAFTTTNMPGGYKRDIPHSEQVSQHGST